MAPRMKTPEQILSEAIGLRADAYRRWRLAAQAEPSGPRRRVYEALAALECDRYEDLLRRFLIETSRSTDGVAPRPAPSLALPLGSQKRVPLRAAQVAAEAERRTWAARLRETSDTGPTRTLLAALVEDARRMRDLVVPGARRG